MKYDGDVNYAANPYGMPPHQSANRRGLLALGFAVVGVVAFAGAAVVGLRGPARLSGDGPPLLTADPGPVKARPDQPGGLEVPHQDILAYERLRDHEGGRGQMVERLLPPPEVPLPRPVVTPQMPAVVPLPSVPSVGQLPPGATATVPRDSVAAAVAAAAPLAPPEPAPGLPALPAAPPTAQMPSAQLAPGAAGKPQQPAAVPAKPAAVPQQQVAAVKPPSAPPPQAQQQQNAAPSVGQLIAKLEAGSPPAAAPAKAAAQPAKTAPAVTGGSGGWRIQLASVRSEGEAAAEWRRIAGRHPDALGGLSMQVAKVELGDKGVFYRVQGAGADEARAKSVCAQLRAQNVGCVVVRP
ncbi:SPOR domain-containing protein (plasmid) [Azospirillum humicireducens]|uniref:SPOR domain-containing protein n=1 Tax=Azospirillum humicireducens TaxID=1226968 RepID=A0A2R4VRD8_9PROT|nr:SPOR domain-containing protein [Azospirillum humicireducens]AWB06996.1 SPOR domain-containing protein [Azospirillum humicireducens]